MYKTLISENPYDVLQTLEDHSNDHTFSDIDINQQIANNINRIKVQDSY